MNMNTILCVDSDQEELDKTRIILEDNGYDTVLCRNPGDAMEWLSQNPPAIVLTEVEFPGLESEKIIKNFIKISSNSVFIIYTKKEERRIGEDRRLDKIFEFISKPTDSLSLIGHLKRASIFGKKRIELKDFVNETRKKINRQLEWSIWEESRFLDDKSKYSITILENIHHSMNQGDGLGSLVTLIDMMEYHKKDLGDGSFAISGEIISAMKHAADTVRSWMNNLIKIPTMLKEEFSVEVMDESAIHEAIDESIQYVDFFRNIKKQTINKDINEVMHPIRANKEVIVHSLNELLTNAFKNSPENSEVRIFSQRAGNSFSIMVSNDISQIEGSATGIPRELENKLFEPFVRVNNLHDDRFHRDTFGMGTGLTTVYHSIFQTGGKLYLYESHDPLFTSKAKKVIAEMIFPLDLHET